MWHVGWVGIAIFSMFAVIAAFALGPRLARLRRIFSAPAARLDALPRSGPVVLQGRVVPGPEPLVGAPFSGRAAARVRAELGHEVTSRGHKILRVELSRELASDFALEDEAGHRVVVTDVAGAWTDTEPDLENRPISEPEVRAFLANNGLQPDDHPALFQEPRWSESGIFEGDYVYVAGVVLPDGSVGASPERRVRITTATPESYASLRAAFKWTFVVFGVICGVMVAIGLIGPRFE